MPRKKNNKANEDGSMLIMKEKVEVQWSYSRDIFTKLVCIPTIKLAGFWLHHYGFAAGNKFEVYAEKNQLVLKVGQRSTIRTESVKK